nr:ubiquitin-conjugating enzyme E2 R2-like [Cherax quadricarinatus]
MAVLHGLSRLRRGEEYNAEVRIQAPPRPWALLCQSSQGAERGRFGCGALPHTSVTIYVLPAYAHVKFPPDYPYSPPSVRFLTKVWHPNVYENGDLCISILHPPVDDPQSGELPCERWNPTQNVRTVLLSVISLLNEPNTYSPANVDASVMYRRWRDSKGKDKEYENIIRKQVMSSRSEAERDGVVVPLTQEDYCIKTKVKPDTEPVDMYDFYDDDYDIDDDDEDDDEELSDNDIDDGDDSGNGES